MTFIVFAFICASAVLSDLFRRNVTSRAANDRFDRFGLDPEQFAHFFRDVFEFSRRIVADHELCFYLSCPLRSTYSATFLRFACAAHGKNLCPLAHIARPCIFLLQSMQGRLYHFLFLPSTPAAQVFSKKTNENKEIANFFGIII